MDVMKPVARGAIPLGNEWTYEVKYDGFRCRLLWTAESIQLISKNNKDLTANFPEIIAYCQQLQKKISSILPIMLDGELTVLNNDFQANFNWIQKRGRLKKQVWIKKASQQRPATLMVFDYLQQQGVSLLQENQAARRKKLQQLMELFGMEDSPIKLVKSFSDASELWQIIFDYKGEGIIAKRSNSFYTPGKQHHDWLKIKNWRTLHAILTTYQPQNDYFTAAVWDNDKLLPVGKCKHGMDKDALQTLKQLFIKNGSQDDQGYHLPPAIVAAIHSLDLYDGEFREPAFAGIVTDKEALACTRDSLQVEQAMLPDTVDFSKLDKLYWPKASIQKSAYLIYMREISPYMLPFLRNHLLTLIRCPDGVNGESFFQKHIPEYAPEFIRRFQAADETFMICDSLESLLWFSNHGGMEFHVPFEKAGSIFPNEIVFDLDPPSRDRFDLAVQAANTIKTFLDQLKLHSFVKLSGNKGLQIHIPIPEKSMSYEQTALFTQAIAKTVENNDNHLFTTERMKKNRNGRLYIDYVQHGKNKTIIAPYSARKTDEGTVATPLNWEEVNQDLRPENFTIKNVVQRVQNIGCPFKGYERARQQQNLKAVFNLLGV